MPGNGKYTLLMNPKSRYKCLKGIVIVDIDGYVLHLSHRDNTNLIVLITYSQAIQSQSSGDEYLLIHGISDKVHEAE